jgi:hypothetical protein
VLPFTAYAMAGFKTGTLKSKSPSKSLTAPDCTANSPALISISTWALVAAPRSTTWCSWTTGPGRALVTHPTVHNAAAIAADLKRIAVTGLW